MTTCRSAQLSLFSPKAPQYYVIEPIHLNGDGNRVFSGNPYACPVCGWGLGVQGGKHHWEFECAFCLYLEIEPKRKVR